MEDEQKAREKISPPQTAHGSDSGQPCLHFPHVPLTVVTEPVPTLLLSIWHLLEAAAEKHSSETCAHMTCSSSVAQTVSLSSICPSRPPLDFFFFLLVGTQFPDQGLNLTLGSKSTESKPLVLFNC